MAAAFNSRNQNNADTFDDNDNSNSQAVRPLRPVCPFGPFLTAAYGTALTAGYRGDGLRGWKHASTQCVHHVHSVHSSITPVCELNSSGTVIASNTFGADGLVSRNSGGASTFYTWDPQGNVSETLNSSGAVLAAFLFDAFGNRTASANVTDPYTGFGGQEGYYTDFESGLQLCGYRYYDSARGRWLNRDPIGYAGGVNLYGYVGNGPVGSLDPTGAIVFITRNKKHRDLIRFVVPIWFKTPLGTRPPEVAEIVRDIEKKWTGTFGPYHVTTRVLAVGLLPVERTPTSDNQITMSRGWTGRFVPSEPALGRQTAELGFRNIQSTAVVSP